jgi:hypothetical protein
MERAQIRFISADTIGFSGMECTGFDKKGRKKYRYEEVFLKEAK